MSTPQLDITYTLLICHSPAFNPSLLCRSFEISEDMRYLYVFNVMGGMVPTLVKDLSVTSQSISANLYNMGYGFTD